MNSNAIPTFGAFLALVLTAPALHGQDARPPVPQRATALAPGDTVMATPYGRYDRGALHRWVLGNGYRDLWATPIPVEVLDLDGFAGGLIPLRLGGGQQTRSLRFQGADGIIYNFRSLDKDAARTLDPELRESLAADILQDQISALFPLSAMVVTALLDAAEVLNPAPKLFVMPDDPRLGDFREEFRGMLGWVEVRPDEGEDDTPGFAGSSRVIGSETLYERLEDEPDSRVDAREFLTARLLDFLVGDWDRHPDQWRWAGFRNDAGDLIFHPVPRDRDWALARLDGMIATFTRVPWPHYVGFAHDYPPAFRISWNGRGLDRWILAELSWPEWEEVTASLQARLTDEVIQDAVRRLPDPYYQQVGPWMEAALLNRRDHMRDMAWDFYTLLSEWVDVEATDEGEWLRAERLPEDRLRIEIYDLLDGEPRPEPYYARTFHGSETREVRIYMHGGDDRIDVVGDQRGSTVLRVVGGGSDDRFTDYTDGRGVHFYDSRGDNELFANWSGQAIDRTEWEEPDDPEAERYGARPRDWGARWFPAPDLGYNPDRGVWIGAKAQWQRYGFRQHPYHTAVDLEVGIGTATGRGLLSAEIDVPLPVPDLRGRVGLLVTGAESERYYGLGNETRLDREEDLYLAERREVTLEAAARFQPREGVTLEGGTEFSAFRPYDNTGTLVSEDRPYGYSDFQQFGLVGSATWDTRDDPDNPRSGGRLRLQGRVFPAVLDVEEIFATLRIEGSGVVSGGGPLRPVLAFRAGGEKVVGDAPYHESAYIGGEETLRGFRLNRFAGDGSLFGAAELRVFLTEFVFLLPGDLGTLAFTDVGRVFLDDEESSRWHGAGGGGLWVTWVDAYTLSLAVARSSEETAVYVGMGFPF